MPENNSEQTQPDAPNDERHSYVPEEPDWEFWRQRGSCRIWQAVLLSMNIEPTTQNRDELQERAPESYTEFRRRREIAQVQYGVHPSLPTMEHPRAGQRRSEKYVALAKVLEFSKEIGWRNLTAFEAGLLPTTVTLPDGETVDISHVPDDLPKAIEDLPKGERYVLVRMGALLKVLEQCLQPDQVTKRHKFLHGTTLNLSALGKAIAEEIAKAAHNESSKTTSRFTQDANRRNLADARDALSTFF